MITDTAFFRNPRYHEPTDTWDTLDYERMSQAVQGVHCALQSALATLRRTHGRLTEART